MTTLSIHHLTKKYGKQRALKGISADFDCGVIGLLGHNGAGKSTLIEILAGSLSYDEGEVLFDGKHINKMGDAYRELIGYMPQQQMLDSQFTVESFLYYIAALKGINHPKKRIEELYRKMNLLDFTQKKVNALSGGMKQRVLMAQALLNDPAVLLLDEPTAGLDPVERKNLRSIISDIAQDRIVIIATHVMSDVEFIAERIILMKNGEILADSTQKELLENTKVYISDSVDELSRQDDSIQVVNTTFVNGEMHTRFISEYDYGNAVPATMDDVYLKWLG